MPFAKKAIVPLATGALSGVGSWGAQKILGKGLFSIPQDKIDKLIKYKSYMTPKQREQILDALQTGSGIPLFQLTKEQIKAAKDYMSGKNRGVQKGGFLGTLLASMVVPELIKSVLGGDMGYGDSGSTNVYFPIKGSGRLMKKRAKKKRKTGKGLILGKNSPFKNIPLLGAIL